MLKKKDKDKSMIIDWYKNKGVKKHLTNAHNPHYERHKITVPFRMLIVGSSGSGKSSTILNIIYNMPDTFEKIVLCCKSKNEPLYLYLEETLKDMISIYEGIENIPDVNTFDKNIQTLVIMDDLVNEKRQNSIEDFFIRARKKGVSTVYISQSFYKTPIMVRNNLTYIIIKQVSSLKNLSRIMNEYSLGIESKTFKKLYDYCTKNKTDFMLIDLENDATRFRRNFDEIIDMNTL